MTRVLPAQQVADYTQYDVSLGSNVAQTFLAPYTGSDTVEPRGWPAQLGKLSLYQIPDGPSGLWQKDYNGSITRVAMP